MGARKPRFKNSFALCINTMNLQESLLDKYVFAEFWNGDSHLQSSA